jgi:hypothetical protein
MLLLHAAADPHAGYSRYLAEILRLEGFVDFAETDLAVVTAAELVAHDLLILPRLTPTHAQARMLVDYVRGGGRLLANLPAPNLATQLGVNATFGGTDGGFLQIDGSQPSVEGLCTEPVQVVTPVAGWALEDDADVAVLARVHAGRPAADAGMPAVVHGCVGRGEFVLLAYDLPHTIARLRQGNPAHADLCFAGLDGIFRPSELFVGQLDPAQMPVPQADVQTALLARLIETLAARPRIWYYPHAAQRSALLMTSDDDWSTLEQFETLLAGLRRRGGHCSFYVVPQTHLTPDHLERWEAEGHTFSVHPALERDIRRGLAKDEPQRLVVAEMLRENVARHRQEFSREPRTIRQHAVRWLGYVEAARVQAELGIRMELNFLSVHPFPLGYMAGSGRPLRFVDVDGTLIDCYQQPTLWTEEVLIHPEFVFSFKWTVARALQEVAKIIGRATQEFYTPMAINSHPVSFATYSGPLIEGCWDAALDAGAPILSADDWLAWTAARDGVRIEQEAGGFTVQVARAMDALTILLPLDTEPQAVQSAVSTQRLWGRTYTAIALRQLRAGERREVRTRETKRL